MSLTMISKKKIYTHKINHIYQKHKTGCGVACMAMILEISYEKAMKILFPRRKLYKKPKVTIKKYILTLKKSNVKFNVKLVDGFDLLSLKNPCILGVRWEDDQHKSIQPIHGWHAVVYHKGKVYDPFIYENGKSYSVKYCKKHVFVIFEIKMS